MSPEHHSAVLQGAVQSLCFWKGSFSEMALTSDSSLVSSLPKTVARNLPSPGFKVTLEAE